MNGKKIQCRDFEDQPKVSYQATLIFHFISKRKRKHTHTEQTINIMITDTD